MLKLLLAVLATAFCAAAQAQVLKPWTGGETPRLELPDPEGTTRNLADYRGKVVLVNFWATWCAPCRAEMPSMERLKKTLQGRPFEILAVNVGESPRVAREFAEGLPVTFTILMDRDTRAAKAWRARVLPATYVVAADGAIRYSHFGDLDWSSPRVRAQIEALLPRDPMRSAGR